VHKRVRLREPSERGREDVETAVESIAPVKDEEEVNRDDGQIVLIRPRVVENVGHVLGNMFQRIYHLVERTREGDLGMGADLDSSIRRLEGFLQLLMDYVSPLSLSLEDVSAAEIAQSLARQVGDAIGRPVGIEGSVSADCRLLADAGRLARAFGLLRLQLRSDGEGDAVVRMKETTRTSVPSLTLEVMISRRCVLERSSEAEIQWSVAEKLLEIHGGMLQQSVAVSGDVLWEIMLPLHC